MSPPKLQLLYEVGQLPDHVSTGVFSSTSYSCMLKKVSPVLPHYSNTYTKGKTVLTNHVFVNTATCRTRKHVTPRICKMELYDPWPQNEDTEKQISLTYFFKPRGPHPSCTIHLPNSALVLSALLL